MAPKNGTFHNIDFELKISFQIFHTKSNFVSHCTSITSNFFIFNLKNDIKYPKNEFKANEKEHFFVTIVSTCLAQRKKILTTDVKRKYTNQWY